LNSYLIQLLVGPAGGSRMVINSRGVACGLRRLHKGDLKKPVTARLFLPSGCEQPNHGDAERRTAA